MYIDTHCHLDFKNYDEDREIVIQRAIKSDIQAIITIGTNIETSKMAIKLAENYASVFAAVGIHPTDCLQTTDEHLETIEELSKHEKVVAIGEVGLDYYHMKATKEKQQSIFRKQIDLAVRQNLPLIIHNRDSHDDIYDIITTSSSSKVGGVMHSFSGDMDFLEKILLTNLHVSFTGNITFKKSNNTPLVERSPIQQLLLETDSPFLTPTPLRGKRNEPAFLVHTAKKIAEIKNLDVNEVGYVTTENAKKLFRLNV
ncbi:MAG: YchF/TatD family DNA exonuclease [Caldithrix sp.]|nr:YchF/TatD family DNA exonuclease [Caldithrix sp.]